MPTAARHRHRGIAWLAVTVSVIAGGAALVPPSRATQTGTRVELTLVRQPLWRRQPAQPLGLHLRIDNRGPADLSGLQVRLVVGDRIESRSELDDTLETPDSYLLFQNSAYTPAEDVDVGAGTTRTVRIPHPLHRLDTLATADQNGVYPLAIVLADGLGQPLDVVTTPLVYYPEKLERGLDLVLVVPLVARPARGPDGRFPIDPPTGEWPLEAAVDARGWLAGIVAALEANPKLHVGVAPEPRLIEEIADMADGYTRAGSEGPEPVEAGDGGAADARVVLDRLRGVLARRGTQPLFMPYAAPDLPAVTRHLAVDDNLAAHFEQGLAALRSPSALGSAVGDLFDPSWLFPPGGRLDRDALEALQSLSPTDGRFKTFFSVDSIVRPDDAPLPGCPRSFTSLTCPITTDTAEPARGFAADPGLQEQLAALQRGGSRALGHQRFFAETAMIREELPSTPRRVAHAVLPAGWHPREGLIRRLFGALHRAPWLHPVTPARGLARSLRLTQRQVVDEAPSVAGEPDEGFYSDLESVAQTLDYFFAVGPPKSLVQRLVRDALAAQSRTWWAGPARVQQGRSFALDAADTAEASLGRIRIGGRLDITLTSRRQPIPLVLFNGNDYAVDVEVHLDAFEELVFDRNPTFEITDMQPGNHPLSVGATARSSGRIPLSVCVAPPDLGCTEPIATATIAVNSTEFNKIALGVTLGALSFLVLFYALRALRRRRDKRTDTSGAAPV